MAQTPFDIVTATLASSLVAGGTFTISYPDDRSKGNYSGSIGHKAVINGNAYSAPADFTLTFNANASSITFTWGSGKPTLDAGSTVKVMMQRRGQDDRRPGDPVSAKRTVEAPIYAFDLGSPIAADSDNMIKAATSTELPNATTTTYTPDTDGTSPTDGVGPVVTLSGVKHWKNDVPRNVAVAVTHGSSVVAMTIVVTGLDEYLNTVVESLSITATGTSKSAAGLKAFKYIRSIAITSAGNATTNTADIGFGDVIGLPAFLPGTGYVVKELQDGAAATAGTVVAGVTSKATATTGDVRGTYDPNAACDGDKGFVLLVSLPEPNQLGVSQYAG